MALIVTSDGPSYREDVDIQSDELYRWLAATDSLPTTSQPLVGPMSLVLGAHMGPRMVGVAYAPAVAFADMR